MNDIRKERTRELYIDITCCIIRQQGIKGVTIRSISEKAGYNSATLYSYFSNLSELIFCAHMKFENELVDIFNKEIENVRSLYSIWPRMYSVMYEYYLENPYLFDCIIENDYAASQKADLKDQWTSASSLYAFVQDKLEKISLETDKDISLINKINDICLAQVTGSVLLTLKRRNFPDSVQTRKTLEDNISKIIKCFTEGV
ncbi:MAG: TetR/AcrR family transcriptional regulator [Oscillospiraceae bacterium]|nr:TetR/AcrR family transcriptional regulator [Oscillospiraceae bacterium]